jgi:hypothetical protein
VTYDLRDVRRRDLAAEITVRLSRVRGVMTDAEFARLVADVVRTAERFAEIDGRWPTDTEVMRRLIAEE